MDHQVGRREHSSLLKRVTFARKPNSFEANLRRVASMSLISTKAEAFLNAYVSAFEAFDAARIADFYHSPCLTVRGDGQVMTFATGAEAFDFFSTVIGSYQDIGMTAFAFSEVEVASLGNAAVRLTCHWQMLREDASIIRAWHQTYVIRCSKDKWTILSSVFHQ
ncbi:DUF4440 domain-containing protein [Aestuariicoccus sp. MJ-SS9]|uniref:DUF4440 domain-containing protein n=1 Tax=Aestuariicoccus sp. MJ-SS9 TaxID=3079855 RepID=UPI0029108C93|nr:DUF4440 domain-containing protein [Aestuariicoccus sp. MJ-SS9]MDU8911791.1 hypothetical protein [Aestuariicoccus sp. MJ-SS9]